jgi:hypothetical protein
MVYFFKDLFFQLFRIFAKSGNLGHVEQAQLAIASKDPIQALSLEMLRNSKAAFVFIVR